MLLQPGRHDRLFRAPGAASGEFQSHQTAVDTSNYREMSASGPIQVLIVWRDAKMPDMKLHDKKIQYSQRLHYNAVCSFF